jgi:hypothetical protein
MLLLSHDGLRCYAGYAVEGPGEFPMALVTRNEEVGR